MVAIRKLNPPSRCRGSVRTHLLILAGGFLLGGLLVKLSLGAVQNDPEAAEDSQLSATEKAEFRREIMAARAQANQVKVIENIPVAQPVETTTSPREIIQTLETAPIDAEGWVLRRVVMRLELLIDHGPRAVPAIRDYLRSGNDRQFLRRKPLSNDAPAHFNPSLRPMPQPSFVAPISLRVGLMEALRQINTSAAHAALVETLRGNRNGYEIALLAELLERIAPKKHYAEILDTCQAALTDTGGQLKDIDYLFGLLTHLNHPKVTNLARQHLTFDDGKINPWAVRTLNETAGAKAIPEFVRLFDQMPAHSAERKSLTTLILPYVGIDPTADAFFQRALKIADHTQAGPSTNHLKFDIVATYLMRSPTAAKPHPNCPKRPPSPPANPRANPSPTHGQPQGPRFI